MNLATIGAVHTGRHDHDSTPVQTALNREEPGEIHLDPVYASALEGLDGFSHLWIVTWLGTPEQDTGPAAPMVQTPFLLRPTGASIGTFAMRGPRRPNPIGLHLVRIRRVSLDPPIVYFLGVDMVDGTPVVDLKPWVSRFDLPVEEDVRSGWFDDLQIEKTTPAELAEQKEETE